MSDDGVATARGPLPWSRSDSVRVYGNGEDHSNASNGPSAPLNLPKTPRKLGRQPVKGHKRETLNDIARRVPVSVMREYFNFSLRQAADAMSISVTSLKRLCRRHGVKRWPHRQLSGLNRAVAHLEEKQQTSNDPSITQQLQQLYVRRDMIIDQAFTSDDTGSESRRDSPSRSDNEAGGILLDSGHHVAPEQDATPAPPRLTGNVGTTTWRQREPTTDSWQHQQSQHQHQQHRSDHDRGFEAGEGAEARGEEDYPPRGWGRSSSDESIGNSMGRGQGGFRASHVAPSSVAPENRPEQGQARRSSQRPMSRVDSASEISTSISPGRPNMGSRTNPSHPGEKVSDQHPSENLEAPVTKIAVLNALLLGGGPSDGPAAPGSMSRARATAGGTHPRRRRCSEGPKGGRGGEGEAWGRRQNDGSRGPLPSIARLVEAGALLSGAGEGDWR